MRGRRGRRYRRLQVTGSPRRCRRASVVQDHAVFLGHEAVRRAEFLALSSAAARRRRLQSSRCRVLRERCDELSPRWRLCCRAGVREADSGDLVGCFVLALGCVSLLHPRVNDSRLYDVLAGVKASLVPVMAGAALGKTQAFPGSLFIDWCRNVCRVVSLLLKINVTTQRCLDT